MIICMIGLNNLKRNNYPLNKNKMDNINYQINDVLVARRDYLDLFKKDKEYQICDIENNLGDIMFYVSHEGKKISQWGLKSFELDINFYRQN